MKQLTCEMCGSTEVMKNDGFFVCQTCGTRYSVEEAKKMMIDGTVEVQGTVKLDNTEFVKNALRMRVEQKRRKIGKKQKNIIIWLSKMTPIILKQFFIVHMVKRKLT